MILFISGRDLRDYQNDPKTMDAFERMISGGRCRYVPPPEEKKCKNCKTVLKGNEKFCPECGTKTDG